MKWITIVFSILVCSKISAQDLTIEQKNKLDSIVMNNDKLSSPQKLFRLYDYQKTIIVAKKDIQKNTIYLFAYGGSAPIIYTTDEMFEQKYNLTYDPGSCINPEYECLKNYNYTIFDYLMRQYGKKWLRTVRKDIVGLKEWKKAKNHKKY